MEPSVTGACMPCLLVLQARHRNPKTPELWLAAIRTEQRAGSTKAAEALLAKGLQDCPASGLLWGEAIAMAPRPQRRSKAADAMKRCDNDPHVVSNKYTIATDCQIGSCLWDRCILLHPGMVSISEGWSAHNQGGTNIQCMAMAVQLLISAVACCTPLCLHLCAFLAQSAHPSVPCP